MFVIADNITTRNPDVDHLFQQLKATGWDPQQEPARKLKRLVERCLAAGADAIEINVQQHHDRPEVMEAAVKAVQQVTDRRICLSANTSETLKAGVAACKQFPLVNYISLDKTRLSEVLPLAANHGAEVVLLVSDPSGPTDAREMLGKAAALLGATREMGIPGDRVFVDPGLIHVTHDAGQRHLAEVREFLSTLPEAFDPPIKSTCWIGNISTGAPQRLRPVIETAVLGVLATLGLSSAFIDVLRPENARAIRLLKILNNEEIYSDANVELKLV